MIPQCRGITKHNQQCQKRVKHNSHVCKQHRLISPKLLNEIKNNKYVVKQRFISLLSDIRKQADERYLMRCEDANESEITLEELITFEVEDNISFDLFLIREHNKDVIASADGRIELMDFNILVESLKCKMLPMSSDLEEQLKSDEFIGCLNESSIKTVFKYLSDNYTVYSLNNLFMDYIYLLDEQVQQGIVQEKKYIDVCKRIKDFPDNTLINIMAKCDYDSFFGSIEDQVFGVGWMKCPSKCEHSFILLTTQYEFYKKHLFD